jgi:DNA-binding Xre family transcriptional regulator
MFLLQLSAMMQRYFRIDNESFYAYYFMRNREISMITSNLKYIMTRQGVTISRLAELARLSPDTIARVRRTKKIGECKLNTLEKIAKTLHCKIKDIFEEERDDP